jgi:threonine/homoserine/homoserine lactone efflux protein
MDLHILLGQAGVLTAAALSPGPNNLVVMSAAARHGFVGTWRLIAGIVTGGLVLLALTVVGTDLMFVAHPAFKRWLALLGTGYLCYLGFQMCLPGRMRGHGLPPVATNSGTAAAWRMFAFQFMNPKCWALMLSLAAYMGHTRPLQAFLALGVLFALISTLCLLTWSALGRLLENWLSSGHHRWHFDLTMGLLLIAGALHTLVQT